MAKEQYRDQNFTSPIMTLILALEAILDEYERGGYVLTLRQLYYQMIARDLFPDTWIDHEYNLKNKLPADTKNTLKNYKRMGDIVSNAKYAGMIDWDAMEDRARAITYPGHWDSPKDILLSAAHSFRLDRWADQEHRVVVMVEKQALEGILIPVCQEMDVRFTANKGYASGSHLRSVAQLMSEADSYGQRPVVLYLGDHDPSGMDMTRDVGTRIEEFAGCPVEVIRLALNRDQVDELDPPENPAKTTDSRAAAYIVEHGESSWELDAIEPCALAQLVRDAVMDKVDLDKWDVMAAKEDGYRSDLRALAAKYKDTED